MKVLGREWRRKKEAMGRQKGELGVLSNGTEHADVRAPHVVREVDLAILYFVRAHHIQQ